jgi:aspartate/methionine/tyrosine aminotransferase
MNEIAITPSSLLSSLREEARLAPESGIVEVMNYGRDRPGMIPLWAGEGDLPTPDFICAAAARSLEAGETFYTWQRGIPDLRQALADYRSRLHGRPFSPDRFFITGSGMQAIQTAKRMVAGTGDEVIVPTPGWPNSAAATEIGGARAVNVVMDFTDNGWQLDLQKLFDACGPKTRAIFINSPGNPTGWVLDHDDMCAVLAFARKKGLWIIADEVYERFYFDGSRAPSFHDVAEPEDRILYVNTFSKNWAMTGWRIGWIEAPAELGQVIENLIQYSTSGVAAFMQRAAIAGLNEGEEFIAYQVDRARQGRDIVCDTLAGTGRVRFARPAGAFYLFFAIDGEPDVRKLGLRLVDEANVGLAPGTAFGPGGEGFMRLCFARGADSLAEAANRLADWLRRGKKGS